MYKLLFNIPIPVDAGGSTEDTSSIPAGRCPMLLILLGTEGIMELSVQ